MTPSAPLESWYFVMNQSSIIVNQFCKLCATGFRRELVQTNRFINRQNSILSWENSILLWGKSKYTVLAMLYIEPDYPLRPVGIVVFCHESKFYHSKSVL